MDTTLIESPTDTNMRMIKLYEARNATTTTLVEGVSFYQYYRAAKACDKAERHIATDVEVKKLSRPFLWQRRNRVFCCSTSMNIFVLHMNTKRTIQVENNQTLAQICVRQNINLNGWCSYGGRPMKMDVPICEYGVSEGSTIIFNARLLGGSTTPPVVPARHAFRLYTHIVDSEHLLLTETFRLQADEFLGNEPHSSEDLMTSILKTIEGFRGTTPGESPWLCELLENFFQVVYWTRRCRTKADYTTCVMLSYKLITGKSVSGSVWKAFALSNLQDDMFTKVTRDMRDMFQTTSVLVNNPIMGKLRKIYTYLLVQGFLAPFGQELSVEEFLKMDAKVKRTSTDRTSMVLLILETAITICERLDAYRLTGDWHALVHDDATYTAWVKTAERLINLAPFTANLAAHGTTYFTFVSDLNDCVEKGEAICRYSAQNSGAESALMRKRLCSLQMLKNVEITRRASQKERKAPFGVLIHGGSSVGKSSFTKMLFYYYGKLHGLDTDDHFRYVRNPADEYWSNFDSSKWCIQMDDIAFLLPSKSSEVDATLKEMLNVVNNVPYVPPQAALEDKGKTPVMAKLVLATSNAPDLNAQDYFHCPLAVRRRLPYVIHVRPKPEYLAENGKFLEPSRLPLPNGQFPDYWIIEIQKLVPVDHNGRDSAVFETVHIFSDVQEFLRHFAEASLRHEKVQVASDTCDVQMRDIKVCRLCYSVGDSCECLQGLVLGAMSRMTLVYFTNILVDICSRLFLMLVCTTVYAWALKFYVVRHLTARVTRFLDSGIELKVHSILNSQREYKLKIAVRTFVKVGLVLTNLFLCYKAGKYVWNATAPPTSRPTQELEEEEENEEWCEQGNIHGTTEEQLLKEDTQNVWYNPTLELNKFDVPIASRSLANYTPSQVRDLFSHNCVRIEVTALDAQFATRMGAIFLRGQYLCFNRHALRLGTKFKVLIATMGECQGISANIECYIERSDVMEIVERDIVVVRMPNVPPRKDILKYWNDESIPTTHMVSLQRTRDGCVHYRELFNVQLCRNFPVESLAQVMDVYMGTGSVETKVGDCGSLGVAITPQGPIILGLHTLGHNCTAAFPHVTRSQLESICVDPISNISGEGSPMLSLNGDVELIPPHHKSVLRYLSQGTAHIYGSFPGFRPKPRSRVCPTPLREVFQEHFKCDITFDKPVMTGWEPVHNNVCEMVKPYTDVKQSTLDHCVESFTNDIISGLTAEHGDTWKGELLFLSRKAAINGLPGVKFIDRINTSTSMGHPWCTTKTAFLEPDVSEEYPEGVTFTPEVLERMAEIEKKYAAGQRAFPVFTGHLKDEPTSHAKIKKKKTRIFTGAPVDWSIVVRSRLLSFVRLLQKNKFIFEAAPGTAAQSAEWTRIYEYLTKFGIDRIIAGDYGKFDKHMIAMFILAAFKVIGNIHKAAGFTDAEIREIYGIGLDTAFPVTNMMGDLLEFFGTNPSGHPLTVIINSIVNSLYMRYAFCILNPESEECTEFKRLVHLLTYGDDNTMGVDPSINWFNHTAIQQALAQIGVEYTMADKEAISRPYISIDECSFLKRTWRFEEELGLYTCPLEEASIHRSLTTWLPSKTIDKYKQMVDVVTSANNEYFFYGKEVFTKHHNFFKEILKQEPYSHYVSESTLPDWEDLKLRFQQASRVIPCH